MTTRSIARHIAYRRKNLKRTNKDSASIYENRK